jgi:hypothetical protein
LIGEETLPDRRPHGGVVAHELPLADSHALAVKGRSLDRGAIKERLHSLCDGSDEDYLYFP